MSKPFEQFSTQGHKVTESFILKV